eukprot:6211829-Pleurochrysis_carterae.AAC.1
MQTLGIASNHELSCDSDTSKGVRARSGDYGDEAVACAAAVLSPVSRGRGCERRPANSKEHKTRNTTYHRTKIKPVIA